MKMKIVEHIISNEHIIPESEYKSKYVLLTPIGLTTMIKPIDKITAN
jgi:hypothetical protein